MPRAVVVVPCFDEEVRLPVESFLAFLASVPTTAFYFVNDGSRDGTLHVLETLREKAPDRIQVLDLSQRRGKAEAVRRGVLAALDLEPDYVGYWDADLATPLSELPGFCALLDERPELLLVMGSRVRLLGRAIDRDALRHYLGRASATAISLTLDLPVYDTQCGAKLLRVCRETRALFAQPFLSGWLFDVELLARLIRARRLAGAGVHDVVYELPLRKWHDAPGSKVRPGDYLRSGVDLFRIWRRYLRGSGGGPSLPEPRA